MNKRLFLLAYIISTFTLTVQAIEGYKDIYLDREQEVTIHSIFCGKTLSLLMFIPIVPISSKVLTIIPVLMANSPIPLRYCPIKILNK